MFKYGFMIVGVVLIAALGYIAYLQIGAGDGEQTITDLRLEIWGLNVANAACKAQAENITEDNKSDAEVDNIPDDGLRDVPADWLR